MPNERAARQGAGESVQSLGERITGLAATYPSNDQQGELFKLVNSLVEQCNQLEAENHSLREQCREEIYYRVFQKSYGSNAILERRQDGDAGWVWIFKELNQRLASFLGGSPEELRGKRFVDVVGEEEDLHRALELADYVNSSDHPAEITGSFGKVKWNFSARLTPLGHNQVAFTGMDISPRLRLEEEMRVLRTLAENIPEGIAIADAGSGVIRMVSRHGRKQVGMPDELLVNLPLEQIPEIWQVFDPVTLTRVTLDNIPMVRTLRTGEVIENEELVLEVAGGKRVIISVQSVPVRNDKGIITGAVTSWEDVTDRKRQATERENLIQQLRQEQVKSAKLAADAHERAEELETIFNSIVDSIVIFRGGKPVRWNPSAQKAYGLGADDFNIERMRQALQPRDLKGSPLDGDKSQSVRAARGEIVRDELIQIVDLEGKTRMVVASASPLYREGKIDGTVSVWRDVTEREDLITSLSEERSRLQAILDNAPDGIALTDEKGSVVFINQVAKRLRTRPSRPITDVEPVLDYILVYPDGTQCFPPDNPINRSLRDGEVVVNARLKYVWPDGEERPILVSTGPIRNPDGKIRGGVAVFQDISALVTAEDALRRSQELYRLMGETLPYGVWHSDASGEASYISQSFLDLLGMSLEETRSLGWLKALIPEDRKRVAENWKRSILAGEKVEHELHIPSPDGSITTVLSRGLPLRNEHGEITGWAGINLDITDRKALAEQVGQRSAQVELQHHLIYQREQERLKIAQELHDGPIQQLYGVVYTLKAIETEMNGRQAQDDLKSVEESLQNLAREMRQFCNDLRPPSLGAFGLESAIQSQADNIVMRNPGLHVQLDLDDEGLSLQPEVRLALFRVCQELLINAARHANARTVNVSLKIDPQQVRLEVKDDGQGFTVPAAWIDQARSGHLGLVGVQERVDAVAGSLEISSAAGEGTRVIVTVPIQPNPPES